jgi:L-lactate dehydrogenase complex protein LldE
VVRVAFFVTCLTDTFFPRVGVAAVRVLRYFGCPVEFPADQTCCGQAAYNAGLHDEARELARRFIDVFAGFDYVVTPSASCASMVRDRYPELLRGDPAAHGRAQELAAQMRDFPSFLRDVLRVNLSTVPTPHSESLTYHYSCHLREQEGPASACWPLGTDLPVEYRPAERVEQCCGFGGVFTVIHPAVSEQLAHDKVRCLLATGADRVICNDAGCAMSIGGTARRMGVRLRISHIAEYLAECLGLMEPEP